MTITRTVTVAAGVLAPGHLGELARIVPFELADAVLAHRSVRTSLVDQRGLASFGGGCARQPRWELIRLMGRMSVQFFSMYSRQLARESVS